MANTTSLLNVRQYLVGVATGAGALLLAFMRFVVRKTPAVEGSALWVELTCAYGIPFPTALKRHSRTPRMATRSHFVNHVCVRIIRSNLQQND